MAEPAETPRWRKSSRSSTGNCVEVWRQPDEVLLRDSKDPHGAVLTFDRSAFSGFLAGVQAGEFDLR